MLKTIQPGVFVIPQFLLPGECADLIESTESAGYTPADVRTDSGPTSRPEIRNNDRVMLISDDVFVESWVALLWSRLLAEDLPVLGGQRPVGLPRDLRFYRYGPGQRFKMHKDGHWKENGLTSQLTFLVYLNDGFSGGHTDFRGQVVIPKAGDALLFEHATWHEGAVVTSGTKYVLRSDVLYSA